jgi:hypothetical protein
VVNYPRSRFQEVRFGSGQTRSKPGSRKGRRHDEEVLTTTPGAARLGTLTTTEDEED